MGAGTDTTRAPASAPAALPTFAAQEITELPSFPPKEMTFVLVLVGNEVLLARAADRAEPIVGDLLEPRARRDAPVGVSLGRVVDEPARLADPFLGCGGLGQGARSLTDPGALL